jgi:hypothetical protein
MKKLLRSMQRKKQALNNQIILQKTKKHPFLCICLNLFPDVVIPLTNTFLLHLQFHALNLIKLVTYSIFLTYSILFYK